MKWLIPLAAFGFVSGCGTMNQEELVRQQPRFDLYQYFQGETQAWGLFEDRFGTMRRQFKVDITGKVVDGELVLQEDFLYDDGERERRVWNITRDGDQHYIGKAADVVGEARGRAIGNSLHWRYVMNLKVGEGSWRVNFDDWMYLQSDGVLINRAKVKKFGLEIGSVSLFFRKPEK